MKVYVDVLPKNCFECPLFSHVIELGCNLDDGSKDYFKDEIDGCKCPLKTCKQLKKEWQKEMNNK